jgi:hypothetical protein
MSNSATENGHGNSNRFPQVNAVKDQASANEQPFKPSGLGTPGRDGCDLALRFRASGDVRLNHSRSPLEG